MSVVLQAALQIVAELLKLYNAGKLTQANADAAVNAAIAALHEVPDPS